MVGGDFTSGGSDKKVSVVMFAINFNVSFITSLSIVDGSFELHIVLMATRSSIFCVVKNCLIRSSKLKYVF